MPVAIFFPTKTIKFKFTFRLILKIVNHRYSCAIKLFFVFAFLTAGDLGEQRSLFKSGKVRAHMLEDRVIKFEKFLIVNKVIIPGIYSFEFRGKAAGIKVFLYNRRLPHI